ncbi:hypothetical protein KFE25_005894 [Diacronema lutheri]|uniref:WLM domain-containing protein n=1 Tax=Diacronema lutheri TaxID=2081491 RepID=A0A8J5XS12_DIALT|nr:hypothetical protein KFE25_005894 [Diacronema lutheri]
MANSSSYASAAYDKVWEITAVKKLRESDKAAALLGALNRHIEPLLKARGWRVKKLYEMCCCTAGGKNLSVGGFCCPAGDKRTSLRIAIRLRVPHTHGFYSFDRMMRVLIHEVTHIVHGNHSAQFYGLMDELGAQYAQLKAKGMVLDANGFPTIGGQSADASRHNPRSVGDGKAQAARAAEARLRTAALQGGGRLGSGSGDAGDGAGGWRGMRPRDAAAHAALARARQADREVGLGDAELDAAADAASHAEPVESAQPVQSAVESAQTLQQRRRLQQRRQQQQQQDSNGVIDLDGADDGTAPHDATRRPNARRSTSREPASGDAGPHGRAQKRVRASELQPCIIATPWGERSPQLRQMAAPTAVIDLTTPPSLPSSPLRALAQPASGEGGTLEAPDAQRRTALTWGKRGDNVWQPLCPVCGPACDVRNHDGEETPAQDEDEGGLASLSG